MANELDCAVKIVSGKVTVNEARILLSGMVDGDVLIVDEIHRMFAGGKASAEWLLHLLENGVLLGPLGPEEQPKITVIGATTDGGKLPLTILSRFPIKPALHPYTADEAALIAERVGARLEVEVGPELAKRVAAAGNRNPRDMRSVLMCVRDIAITSGKSPDDPDVMTEALTWLGVTADGLDVVAARYLVVLLTEFGGSAGERALTDRLNEADLAHAEALLMTHGYVAKTRAGRTLTRDGILRAKELA